MKIFLSFVFGLLLISSTLCFAFQNQGFTNYKENGSSIDFVCNGQCLINVGEKGTNNLISLTAIKGKGTIIAGVMDASKKFVPIMQKDIDTQSAQSIKLSLTSPQLAGAGLEKITVSVIINGAISAEGANLIFVEANMMDKLFNGIQEASQYKEYNPRTVNFLEGPMRNGVYINQAFIWRIIGGLIICSIGRYMTRKVQEKQKWLRYGIGIIVFFWLLFDLFSTTNQVKIFNSISSADNIMDNARLGKEGDFYQFLEFVKSNTTKGRKTFFLAPYPYDFEGRYHNYPHNRLGTLTGSDYIVWYNPYGGPAMGFTDPIVKANTLTRNNQTILLQKTIDRSKGYAKIYIVK